MSGLKLDDLLGKKKEAPQVLDLSKSVVETKEDLKKLFDRVPEYKIRPEKVKHEDVKMREKEFTFKPQRRELRRQGEYSFANPIPPDMRSVSLDELSPVPIDWKMLTPVRPKLKMDEDMFSRMVLMGKLHIRTAAKDANSLEPLIRRSKNRAGILESRVLVCPECSEEFCTGEACLDFLYDCYVRSDDAKDEDALGPQGSAAARKGAAKKKRRSRVKARSAPSATKQTKTPKKRRKRSKKRPAAAAAANNSSNSNAKMELKVEIVAKG